MMYILLNEMLQELKALELLFYSGLHNMLFPIRKRYDNQLRPLMETFGESDVAKAYYDVFGLSEMKQFSTQRNSARRASKMTTKLLPVVAGTFHSGIVTSNFCAPFHMDVNNDSGMTHCFYSPPPHWLNSQTPMNPKAVFALGSALFSLSDFPLQINF